jgi:hypothetical protein
MATACALGGAGDAMTTPLHDEAHALPAEDAIRVGAALQHIVAHETRVADTIDPLAGSSYVESLTKRMEDAAMAEIDRILAMGGALAAIQSGYFQRADQCCIEGGESALRTNGNAEIDSSACASVDLVGGDGRGGDDDEADDHGNGNGHGRVDDGEDE